MTKNTKIIIKRANYQFKKYGTTKTTEKESVFTAKSAQS